MHPDDAAAAGQQSQASMERFGRDARLDARMLKDGQAITEGQQKTLVRELQAYRDAHLIDGKPMSWAKVGEKVGFSGSSLSELVRCIYRGDTDRVCRLVDQFLVREDQQSSGPNIRAFAMLRVVVEVMLAAVTQAIKRRSIGVITGEPGSGKTAFARWFVERNEGAVLITCDQVDCDAKFIIDALHIALKIGTYCQYARQKKREIVAYLEKHKNTTIMVDESQALREDGIELLRTLHDQSDPEGLRNITVILLGDETFYKTVVRSRGGERTPISPQITSRMFPVLSLERHGLQTDDDGQAVPDSVFTKDDIELVVKQQRLRLLRPEAIAWAVKLANVLGHGRLRLAASVLEIGIDIKRGSQATVDDLRAALEFFLGPSESKLCVEAMQQQRPMAVAKVG